MKRNVFIVTHLSAHDENCGYIAGIFDTEEDARAYVQTQIDKGRRKHKCEYGGEWQTDRMPGTEASAKVCSDSRLCYVMYIEKHQLYTKDDIKELE